MNNIYSHHRCFGWRLVFFISLLKPKRCLEVGTYCGYSAMIIAQSIDADSRLDTCEINNKTAEIALRAWKKANIHKKIRIHMQPAIKTLIQLSKDNLGKYDFIFIDGDKTNYPTYYLLAKDLLRTGGIIIIDNISWNGQIIDEKLNDRQVEGIRQCNKLISRDKQVISCIIPLGDGMFLIQKN